MVNYGVSKHYAGSMVSDRCPLGFLLNLINSLHKRDKMLSKPRILSLFRNEFNKFNNTGARILDSM